jgi:hypothetical protein
MAAYASYTDLITCLEMARDARKLSNWPAADYGLRLMTGSGHDKFAPDESHQPRCWALANALQ